MAADVLEGYGSILVRPDLHIVWRGHGAAPDPDRLAAVATGHADARDDATSALREAVAP